MSRRCLCGSGKEYEKCCMGKINPFSNEITLKQHMAGLSYHLYQKQIIKSRNLITLTLQI